MEAITCGQCDHPSLCSYCMNGMLDKEGEQKLKRIYEDRNIIQRMMEATKCNR